MVMRFGTWAFYLSFDRVSRLSCVTSVARLNTWWPLRSEGPAKSTDFGFWPLHSVCLMKFMDITDVYIYNLQSYQPLNHWWFIWQCVSEAELNRILMHWMPKMPCSKCVCSTAQPVEWQLVTRSFFTKSPGAASPCEVAEVLRGNHA